MSFGISVNSDLDRHCDKEDDDQSAGTITQLHFLIIV